MNILMVGDLVGGPGRKIFARIAGQMKQRGQVDMIVANAENSAGGKGITRVIAGELFDAGADVLTMGDHMWDQKEIITFLETEKRIVRPANFAPGCPGRGIVTVETPKGRVTVINLVGRVFMPPMDCPFRAVDALLAKEPNMGKVILVDFHAEATSEKIAMGRHLDGRVSAMVGTHTHVQTSDETIMPKKTAYLTDLGMTGPKDSIIGRDYASVMNRFLTGMPSKFEIAEGNVALEGALLDVDEATGRARKIVRVREFLDHPK
ncbi:MAG: TIGR00282 family metallophosphoesterase [bacterium]